LKAGIDFVMSTNVPLIANLPSSGKSSYATYITADETMFSIALGGFEDVPDESNLVRDGRSTHGEIREVKFSLIDSKAETANEAEAAKHRERLNERTPSMGDVIVRSHGKKNHESRAEMTRLVAQEAITERKANIYQFAPNAFDPGWLN